MVCLHIGMEQSNLALKVGPWRPHLGSYGEVGFFGFFRRPNFEDPYLLNGLTDFDDCTVAKIGKNPEFIQKSFFTSN